MLKPLIIGNKLFPNNLIQGPLAGVSCAPFRMLTWRYSQPAFSYTEMISCKTILTSSWATQKRYVYKDPAEGPVCFQLSSQEPTELAEAVKRVTEAGADLIDLNCGCPMNKIRTKGTGSRLLAEPQKLYQLITAMKKNTHVPVSIKIRVDGASSDKFNHLVAQAIIDAGADFVTVHGRNWRDDYEQPCMYEQIQFFVEELPIPVIGNGDIADLASLNKMWETGCAGAMIARAGMGRPWLIGNLKAEMLGEPIFVPTLTEIGEVLLEHVMSLNQLLGSEKQAILQARKFAKYYVRPLENSEEFLLELNNCRDLAGFIVLCGKYFCCV